MSGSEAGTKYRAFLNGVGKAQKALGLEFTDSHGRMLPMVDILNEIRSKFGDTLDVAEGDALGKAFGTSEAVAAIQLLMKDVDGLNGSINKLGQVKGMEQAQKMAAAMTDQSQRLSQSWFVIRAAFGSAILPAFNSFVGWVADMGKDVIWFTQTFPNLTKWLGYAAVAVLGLVAVGGLFTIMMGASNMAMVAWGVGGKVMTAALWLLGLEAKKSAASMLGFNLVMAANPVGLIVTAIAAAVVAIGALIYYWDDLKATMSEWGWVKAIGNAFDWVWSTVKNFYIGYINWWIDKLNMIPGLNIDLIGSSSTSTPVVEAIAPVQNRAERGGITQQISNANQQRSTHVGSVNVYPTKGDGDFMNYVEMMG